MKRIPFTQSLIVSGSEAEEVLDALEQAAQANVALLKDWMAAEAKARELAGLIVSQSDAMQQIMQVNLLVSDAFGKIRGRAQEGDDPGEMSEFIEETALALEAALQEFNSGAALA